MTDQKSRPLQEGEKKIEKYIYSTADFLGKGSFASVYLGRQIYDGSPAAIKVIDKKIFANHYNLKNVHYQIDIMKKLNHENNVNLLDVYQTNNNMYIITQYCPQGDLRAHLKKKKKLSQNQAIALLKDIVRGFQYIHQKEIIHRDLKPANLLLKDGKCKISDFGFARNLENGENTILNSIVGTPLYMSPQILAHQKYTSKSDLWSVGLIFYEMLHGYTPWPANNELQLINNINNKPVIVDSSVSDLSKDFIKKCLRRRQQDRMSWQDAFCHPLFKNQFPSYNRNRAEDKQNKTPRRANRDVSRDKSQKYFVREKSRSISANKKINTTINRTPKNKSFIKADNTPDKTKSNWRF